MELDEHLFDKFTHIDNLIAKNTQVLERLERTLASMGLLTGATQPSSALNRLVQLEEEMQDRELKIVFFTYPATGVKATLAAGTTKLDFETGNIVATTGAVTKMSHSLQSSGKKFLRSFFVNSDASIKIKLDASDYILSEEEKDLVGTHQEFKTMEIVTSESTEIFVVCCTNSKAILQLIDKPSTVSGATRLVYADLVDTDGTGNYFETDQAIGVTPTLFLTVYPSLTKRFKITSVRYQMTPSAAETYELYLLEQSSADNVQNLADIVFDSDSAQTSGTSYMVLEGDASGKLPIEVNLADSAKLYFQLDWSGAPGNTTGYISVRGEKLV